MIKIRATLILFIPVFCANLALKTDTVKLNATGVNNQVIINGQLVKADMSNSDTANLSGVITQTGKSNQIEINTTDKNKADSTKTSIAINQTGNNNKVKINSK